MQKWMLRAAFVPSVFFPWAALVIGLRNPSIFDAPELLIDAPLSPVVFFILFAAVLILRNKSIRLQENLAGVLLFFLFTAGYFLLASIFNKPEINTNNIYFAADNWSWYQRMAAQDGWNVGTRAVHPLAHLIFRPLVICLSLFTVGDRFHANLILIALAGGGCVFLAWKNLRQYSSDETFAILFASLLGLSASHLVFATVIESYIFSTLCLLFFIWLLLNNKNDYLLVITGVFTLGITITNIAQQGLAALFIRKKYRWLVLLFSIILLVAAGLNIVSRLIYPASEYFFIPGNLSGEQRFAQEVDLERVVLMAENIFVYGIAAPQPYSSMRNEMPRFNFLNGTISEYAWFGWPALVIWVMILCLAIISYFKDSTHRRIATAMLACLLFNFILHIGYGIEPFLYSADWTYALVLFAAFSLVRFAERTWFQLGLLALVSAVLLNNLWFIYLIARKVADFLV